MNEYSYMKTAINIDINYDQVLTIVKSLPMEEKVMLSHELEKEGIKNRLLSLVNSFATDELSEDDITKETETVRQSNYDKKKH